MEVSGKNEKSRIARPVPYSSVNTTLSKSDENLAKCPPVTLSWHNIVVTHKKSGRIIIDRVSGIVNSGQAVALMGASGAGKTTLLNTLLNRNLNGLQIDGQVLVDGIELGERITNVSGYVQQEELFLPTLTVKEHLLLQARLRLTGTDASLTKKVDEIMVDLGLMKCRNTRIGISGVQKGISGGESKRLMVAGELLNDPPLLFFDEPTTGLDSAMAEAVVGIIRKLVEKGHTAICTIHQPSAHVFNLFHQVMFLAGGRLAYFGPPQECVEMFARFGFSCRLDYNPADMLIETLAVEPHNEEKCLERINRIANQYADSEEGRRLLEDIAEVAHSDDPESKRAKEREHVLKARQMASFSEQVYTLLRRSLLDNWRNPALVRAKLMLKIFMGIFVGLLYFGTPTNSQKDVTNVNGALYFMVNDLTYATAMGILSFLPDDFPLVVREYHDGLYYLISYYIARCLSYVPLFTIDGLLMMGIAYYMIGLSPAVGRFAGLLGISLLIEQSAAAFGVMLSTVSPSYPVAIAIAAPLLTVMSLTGGLYTNVGTLPSYIGWIQYVSWFRYGFEAFAISQWDGEKANRPHECILRTAANTTCQRLSQCIYKINTSSAGVDVCVQRDDILQQFSFKNENLKFDVLIMIALIFSFYILGYFGLLLRVRRAR